MSCRRFVPGSVAYGESIAARYAAGRALSPEAAAVWRDVIAPFMPSGPDWSIVDLGAGTGRFLPLLASFGPAHIVAVDPSRPMLVSAARQGLPSMAVRVVASAERIPLSDAACDAAWMSQSYHHVRDHDACVRELRRVVTPGGPVLLRGTFSDRLDGLDTYFRFFPAAREFIETVPTVSSTVRLFEGHGFRLDGDRRVTQLTCASLAEFLARSRRRADTAFVLMPDEEFERGLRDLEGAVREETTPQPVMETMTLLVFRAQT
jgi:ubiquinone/menaquinone biosynthesis C-methylase UbiE